MLKKWIFSTQLTTHRISTTEKILLCIHNLSDIVKNMTKDGKIKGTNRKKRIHQVYDEKSLLDDVDFTLSVPVIVLFHNKNLIFSLNQKIFYRIPLHVLKKVYHYSNSIQYFFYPLFANCLQTLFFLCILNNM